MIQMEYAVLDIRIKQLHSAPSFVFVVEDKEGRKNVANFFVNGAVHDYFTKYDLMLKKAKLHNCCTSLGVILSCMDGPNSRIDVFPYLIPPLPRVLVRSCVLDFGKNLQGVLHKLHSINFSHMDARLPNICFNEQGEVIRIDFERFHFGLGFNEVDYGDCCTYPKVMRCIYINFIQLMWMILWIMLDDSTVVVYHEMDKLTLDEKYSKLQAFICTTTKEWTLLSNQNLLSCDECVEKIKDAMNLFWDSVKGICTDQVTLKDKLEEHKRNL